MGYSNPILCL